MSEELRIGVVGYYPPTRFDEAEARRLVVVAYRAVTKAFPRRDYVVVSGLTDVGVLAIAYREARQRGWRTSGIACRLALANPFPVDEQLIIGTTWGDESEVFVNDIDVLVRIGGGKQSHREAVAVARSGRPTFEYDLAAFTGA